jgi:uncharacterized membrane protein YdjX (TVP38/TMEM64 family)
VDFVMCLIRASIIAMAEAKASWKPKVAAVVAVLVVLACAHRFGVLEQFSDPARLTRTLLELGAWGYLVFIVAYATLQPFGIPGTVFVVAAAIIWPWPIAYALSMTGTMAASVVGFSFARFVARDWVSRIIPARFKKYDAALEQRAFATVFFMRLVFWMPPLLHAFFGISKVRFWTHFWGSFAGYIVPLFLMSYFGQQVFEYAKHAPPSAWAAAAAAIAVAVTVVVVVRRARGRAQKLAPREKIAPN